MNGAVLSVPVPADTASSRHSSDALTAISRLLAASPDSGGPSAVHELLVHEACGLFGATGAALVQVAPRERLAQVLCVAPPQALPDRRLTVDALPGLVELADKGVPHVRLRKDRARALGRLLAWDGDCLSALVLPLRAGAALDHALVLRGPDDAWGEDPGTLDIAGAFAAAAAAALGQLSLHAEQTMRMAQQVSLARAGRHINERGLDLPAVLHGICAEARAIFDADTTAVYRSAEDGSLWLESSLGLPPGSDGRHIPAGSGLSGRVLRADRGLVTNDYASFADRGPQSPFSAVRSCLAVPLRWNGKLRGVLSVGYTRTRFVDERDLALLEAFGELAAAACRNASIVAELALSARTDGLTGCLNHSALRETLKLEVTRAARTGDPLSVVLLDLDEFKEVNERGGHLRGDEVLKRAGEALQAAVRPYDSVARYGGDEFVIVCPGSDEAGALEIAHRALDRLQAGIADVSGVRGTAATAGVAQLQHGQDALGLIETADWALMHGKQELGRGVAVRASELPDGMDHGPAADRHAVRVGSGPVDVPPADASDDPPEPAWAVQGRAERERLEQRTQQLAIASALGARLSGMLDPRGIAEAVVDELHRAFGYFLVAAVRIRKDGYVEAAAVRGDAFTRLLSEQWSQPRDAGLIGRALRSQQVVLVDDVLLEQGYMPTKATPDVRSELVCPVWVGDELWGVINIEEQRPRAFDENDARLLQTLADQMGSALRSAGLYERLERAYEGTAEALAAALEAKDAYTAQHGHSIVGWADAVGERLGLTRAERRDLRYGAIFHDIGKISVPEAVLNSPGALSPTELAIIRRHTIVGEQILAPVEFLRGVLPIVRHEHERWDGCGYPDGLAGQQIPLAARIVFVCDAYHAMTSNRSYRRAMSDADARAELTRCAGTQFDPMVVDAFLAILRREQDVDAGRVALPPV
jgi:diguanylate cyclase (GGDEF)-like protein